MSLNENDTPEDIEIDLGREAVLAACRKIHDQGTLAVLEGARPEDCPMPSMSLGSLLWLSGLTGSAIATAGTA